MTIHFNGLELDCLDEVYLPSEDSIFLAENLLVDDSHRILDVGTGTGIIALTAARDAAHVLGVDVNPDSVLCAKQNAERNGIENARFLVSDLFENVDEKFDLVVFNPPYIPVEEEGKLEAAWSGGEGGRRLINRFLDVVGDYLTDDGRFNLLFSSLNDREKVEESFARNEFKIYVPAEKKLFFETLYLAEGKRL